MWMKLVWLVSRCCMKNFITDASKPINCVYTCHKVNPATIRSTTRTIARLRLRLPHPRKKNKKKRIVHNVIIKDYINCYIAYTDIYINIHIICIKYISSHPLAQQII